MGVPGGVTAHVHRHRHAGDVGGVGGDIHLEGGGPPADACRAHAAAVDLLQNDLLQLGVPGVRIGLVQGPGGHALGHQRRHLQGAANAHPHDHRRTGVGARLDHRVHYEIDDALLSVGRHQHFSAGHVFRAEPLGGDQHIDLVPGHDAGMHHRRRVVPGIGPVVQGVPHHALAQVTLPVGLAHPFGQGILQAAPCDVYLLSYVQEYDAHARILTDGHLLLPGDGVILQKLFQHRPARGRGLLFLIRGHRGLHVGADVVAGLQDQRFELRGDLARLDFPHDAFLLHPLIYIIIPY